MQNIKLAQSLFERGQRVGELLFAPDGSALATTGGFRGNAIRLWDCAGWGLKGSPQGHRKAPTTLAFGLGALGRLQPSWNPLGNWQLWRDMPLGHRVLGVVAGPEAAVHREILDNRVLVLFGQRGLHQWGLVARRASARGSRRVGQPP